ncbi:MAG: hypothetical protein U0836_22310 [Pirellulales bacterium]
MPETSEIPPAAAVLQVDTHFDQRFANSSQQVVGNIRAFLGRYELSIDPFDASFNCAMRTL